MPPPRPQSSLGSGAPIEGHQHPFEAPIWQATRKNEGEKQDPQSQAPTVGKYLGKSLALFEGDLLVKVSSGFQTMVETSPQF